MQVSDLVQEVDVHPFCDAVWNTPEYEEEWGEKFRLARGLHHRLEYEMVKQGKRKCATLHISPFNYDKEIERFMEDGLVWLPVQRTKCYNGFSHKHFPVDRMDMDSNVYGVLAQNYDDAFNFRVASKGQGADHELIGELLGFPECCCEGFTGWWPEYYDPVYQCALGKEENEGRTVAVDSIHIATHQMMRYVGLRLTSHFPCRLDCEASIEVGKDWYDVAKDFDPKGLKALEEILSLPGEWSVLHGIVVVTTEPFTFISNSLPTQKEWTVKWDHVEGY